MTTNIKLKEQQLEGNIFVHQMFSMRDKNTGQYTFTMDGNFNILLNRIYNNLSTIESVYITVPADSRHEDFHTFNLMNKTIFNSKLHLMPIDYGKNAAETRELFAELRPEYYSKLFDIFKKLTANSKSQSTLVSEFAIEYDYERFFDRIEYVFLMTAVSDDDLSKPHGQNFSNELNIIKNYHTVYMLSENQIRYVNKYIDDSTTANIKLYRLANILSVHFQKSTAFAAMSSTSFSILQGIELICKQDNLIFYPMRIEDERYEFGKVLEKNKQVVITNPTNTSVEGWLVKNGYADRSVVHIFDYSERTYIREIDTADIIVIGYVDKRSEYFSVLSCLSKDAEIWHNDEGIHLSTLEHVILTNATIRSDSFNTEILHTYIK